MTAAEFRSNPDLVKSFRSLLESEIMQVALEVMGDATENPIYTTPEDDVSPHFAHIQFGIQTGYSQFGLRLKALGTHVEIYAPRQDPTYPDEKPEE